MPYMIGGLHFLLGSCLLLYTSWKARYGEVRSIHWFPYDRVGVVNAVS
jgi:hypothetical protein